MRIINGVKTTYSLRWHFAHGFFIFNFDGIVYQTPTVFSHKNKFTSTYLNKTHTTSILKVVVDRNLEMVR